MKKFSSLLLCALLVFAGISAAQADTQLDGVMKKMGTAFKQLNQGLAQPADANKNDYLGFAATMKEQAQAARALVPAKADTLPADQKDAFVASYQKSMDDFSAQVDVLTADLQAGKWDDAKKQLAVLKQAMAAGHKEFRVQKK